MVAEVRVVEAQNISARRGALVCVIEERFSCDFWKCSQVAWRNLEIETWQQAPKEGTAGNAVCEDALCLDQRAATSFCASFAGCFSYSFGVSPALIAWFSSFVLRCLDADTMLACKIRPPRAR
jgi:hypothetical protein